MGRKALIITFIILITFISSFSSSVKACNFDYTYYFCTGTCPAGYTCKNTAPETCTCVSNNPTPTPAPSPTDRPLASPTATPPLPTPTSFPCGGNGSCQGGCNAGHLCGGSYPNCSCELVTCPPPPPMPIGGCSGTWVYNWSRCQWECTSNNCVCTVWSNWYTSGGCCIRECQAPANCTKSELQCPIPAGGCGSGGGGGGGGGSNPTNTPTPTATPTPGPFAKLKNTSFYSPRALIQPIPASPLPFDSDDNASPYFIIASPGSDPGIVSASFISLGAGQPSVKNWKTTESSNNIIFSPASFLSYIKTRTTLSPLQKAKFSSAPSSILYLSHVQIAFCGRFCIKFSFTNYHLPITK